LGTLLVVPAIRQYGWKKPIILTLRNICGPRFKKQLVDIWDEDQSLDHKIALTRSPKTWRKLNRDAMVFSF
jgi:hypothetical protein